MALGEGEFDVAEGGDGIEVWVTQMGPWANMNTAFIDRENGVVAVIDPYDGKGWIKALISEGLEPTHILLTHTHKDHTAGVKAIRNKYPQIEVWGCLLYTSPSPRDA